MKLWKRKPFQISLFLRFGLSNKVKRDKEIFQALIDLPNGQIWGNLKPRGRSFLQVTRLSAEAKGREPSSAASSRIYRLIVEQPGYELESKEDASISD